MSSGASAPILVPSAGTPPSAPTLVPPRRKPSGNKRLGWIILLIVAAIGHRTWHHYYTNVRTTPEAASGRGNPDRNGHTRPLAANDSPDRNDGRREVFFTDQSPVARKPQRKRARRKLPKRRRWRRWRQHGAPVQFWAVAGGGCRHRAVVPVLPAGRSHGFRGGYTSVTSTNGLQTGGGSPAFRSATSRVNSIARRRLRQARPV